MKSSLEDLGRWDDNWQRVASLKVQSGTPKQTEAQDGGNDGGPREIPNYSQSHHHDSSDSHDRSQISDLGYELLGLDRPKSTKEIEESSENAYMSDEMASVDYSLHGALPTFEGFRGHLLKVFEKLNPSEPLAHPYLVDRIAHQQVMNYNDIRLNTRSRYSPINERNIDGKLRPFTCTWSHCRGPTMFKEKNDWLRHENENHRHVEHWICDIGNCIHQFYREDKFLQHLIYEHNFPEPNVETESSENRASALDDLTLLQAEKCRQERNITPRYEPCRFCGRRYNTWERLTDHLAKHMEEISLPILSLVKESILSSQAPNASFMGYPRAISGYSSYQSIGTMTGPLALLDYRQNTDAGVPACKASSSSLVVKHAEAPLKTVLPDTEYTHRDSTQSKSEAGESPMQQQSIAHLQPRAFDDENALPEIQDTAIATPVQVQEESRSPLVSQSSPKNTTMDSPGSDWGEEQVSDIDSPPDNPRVHQRSRQVAIATIRFELVSLSKPEAEYESEDSSSVYDDAPEDNDECLIEKTPNPLESSSSGDGTSGGTRQASSASRDDFQESKDIGDGDDGQDDGRKKRRRLNPPDATDPGPRFACPYQAYETSQPCFRQGPNNPKGGCDGIYRLK